MSCPTVIRVTTAQGPPGIGLPAGGADAGKFVRKAGSTPYAYELVTPDAIGLQQDLAPTSAPVFAGLTISGLAANGLLFTGTGGALTRLPLGAGLAIVGGALTATGGGGSGSVTSVGLSAPAGFSVAGSPVTGSGTLGLVFATGYSLPTDARQAQWDGAVTLAGTAVQPGALAAVLAEKADLDGTGKVPAAQLPGFVDDVVEFANVAAFPVTGEAGKLYISLATNRQYRWSGSIYAEINPSPGSSDAVPEGSVNLYFTSTRGQTAAAAWWAGSAPAAKLAGIADNATANLGTVTSIGLVVPTGFSTTGAITTSGNITLSFSTGYSLPTDARQADWDAAFTQRRTWDGGDQHLNAATGRASLQLGTAAQAAATDFATAAQGTLAATAIQPAALAGYVQTSDARLADAREWSAATIDQAEAEGGTATTRRAFTAQRVRQAIAAWWGGYASSVGQALATAIDAAAGRTAIGAEQAGAAAAAQAFALQRGNHTGTQPASTITGLAAVATSGAYADLSGRFDPTSPGAIGGTTPAAGTFTAGAFTQSILLPGTAPGTPAAGHLYRVVNTLRYRDSGAAEQLLLNATDNLASLADPAAALANIGGMPRTIEFTDLAYAATINIDFAAYNGRFVSIGTLTGNLSITFSNIVRGREVTVTIVSDSSLRTITYPGATPFGGIKQTTLSPSKRMFVSFTVYGSGGGDVDVWAAALPQL